MNLFAEETVWLAQQQMAVLFDTTKQNVSLHINNIFKEGELDKISVVKDYLTTASDGKKYRTTYYNNIQVVYFNITTNHTITFFLN